MTGRAGLSARRWQLGQKRPDAGHAVAFSRFCQFVAELREDNRGCEHAWHPTGLQLPHRYFQRFGHRCALLRAFEEPGLARTPVVAELAYSRWPVLR